jgi:acyl-CoA synthetase (AMP-forming)/AMP-acid ligase II
VLDALRAARDRPVFEHDGRVITGGETLAVVRRMVGGLRRAGLGPGHAVAMVTAVTPEAYAAHLAAHALGCGVAGARPGWSAPQLTHALRGGFDAVVADGPVDAGVPVIRLADLLASPDDGVPPEAAGRADDLARLTFTSGSTGRPKACAQTYRAYSLAYDRQAWPPPLAELMRGFGRCLIHQSLAGPVMMTYLGRCLIAGGTVVIEESHDDLGPLIERHAITATMMPPPRAAQLLRSPADLGALRALVLGGAPATPGLLAGLAGRLGPVVWQGYGQGEAGVIAMLTPADIDAGHLDAVGRPLPAVQVSLRGPGDRPVEPGQVGEVCVRSPHMMAGYWRDPGHTREVLRDGWLHTRDLGHLDENGLLRLTGRTREVILVEAEVCYAGAIERVLAGHPGIDQVYVVGVPDERTGEAVHAFVVPVGAPPPAGELAALVRGALGAASVPTAITFVAEVPVGDTGKPDKETLRSRALSDTR